MPIDDAMVEGRGDVHHRPNRNRAIQNYSALDELVRANDRDFGMIDDRRGGNATQGAEAGQGYGGTGQILSARASLSSRQRDAKQLPRATPQIKCFRVMDNRHQQTAVALRRDSYVDRLVTAQDSGFI